MAYVTILKDGEPWMYCHVARAGAVEKQVEAAKAQAPSATFTHRPSTPIETQHCADAMDEQAGMVEDPFGFFSVPVTDDAAT